MPQAIDEDQAYINLGCAILWNAYKDVVTGGRLRGDTPAALAWDYIYSPGARWLAEQLGFAWPPRPDGLKRLRRLHSRGKLRQKFWRRDWAAMR